MYLLDFLDGVLVECGSEGSSLSGLDAAEKKQSGIEMKQMHQRFVICGNIQCKLKIDLKNGVAEPRNRGNRFVFLDNSAEKSTKYFKLTLADDSACGCS